MTREEAIQVLNEIFDDSEFSRYESWYGTAMDMAIEALADRPTGVWIDKGGYNECSECGEVAQKVELCDCVYERLTKFCPNCGADMRSEKEYLDKTFPEHDGGEWFDITDMMTRE